MNGKWMLYIDQWGNRFGASTVRELCQKAGYSRARRMYQDKKDGRSVHVGYVIGPHWCTAYQPYEGEA